MRVIFASVFLQKFLTFFDKTLVERRGMKEKGELSD
jgi:hypothetical protein